MTPVVANTSLAEVRQQYIDGVCSVREYIEQTLTNIREHNLHYNAFTHIAGQVAIDQAKRLDQLVAQNLTPGPLHGVPIAIKDNIDVRGMPTTAGIVAYQNRVAFVDAVVVEKLCSAGAIIVGKTNLPEGALGTRTENELFGVTHHPNRIGFTPGGSSGGSACAVASGLVPAALGTDTLGSVRIPSAYCGIVGLKPTKGMISLRGTVPMHTGFDAVGPIAGNCADLTTLLDAIAGFDPQCEAAQRPPATLPSRRESLVGVRTIYMEDIESMGCNTVISDGYRRVLDELVHQGVELIPRPLQWDFSVLRRHALVVIENVCAKYHHESRQQHPEGFGEGFSKMLDYGAKASDQKLMLAQQAMQKVRQQFDEMFSSAPLIVMPTSLELPLANTEPARHDEADLTSLANIVGCPALSIPCAEQDGLFAGVQLMMERHSDRLLLKLGAVLEKGLGSGQR